MHDEKERIALKQALKMVEVEFENAKRLDFVQNPLAYALYRVWRSVDKADWKAKKGRKA